MELSVRVTLIVALKKNKIDHLVKLLVRCLGVRIIVKKIIIIINFASYVTRWSKIFFLQLVFFNLIYLWHEKMVFIVCERFILVFLIYETFVKSKIIDPILRLDYISLTLPLFYFIFFRHYFVFLYFSLFSLSKHHLQTGMGNNIINIQSSHISCKNNFHAASLTFISILYIIFLSHIQVI